MLERLRDELRAIRYWPCGNCPTESEKDAVGIRALRTLELEQQIRELVSRN